MYSFLTDLEIVIIYKAQRIGEDVFITETIPLAYNQGGAAAVVSLLLLSPMLSGLLIPVVPGWTVGEPIGSGATSTVFKVTKEDDSKLEAVFKYVLKPGKSIIIRPRAKLKLILFFFLR